MAGLVRVHRLLPSWISTYERRYLRFDLVAGLTTSAVVVPSAMAYASLAGLPPEVGLYTALVALPLYALCGTSPVLSVSVTSTLAILTGSSIAAVAGPAKPAELAQAAACLALLTSVALMLAGVLRLGFLTSFISTPVLVGFKAGMGIWIASSQLGKVLGIPFQSSGFLRNVEQALSHLGSINWPTVGVAATGVALIVALARFVPRIPGALVVVAAGIAGQLLLHLDGHGVALVTRIPAGLPFPAPPDLRYASALWPAALGVALMSSIESISAARAFAPANRPRVNADRELLALAVANAGAALSQGLPAGGGTSQTAVNAGAGARSQVSQLVATAVVALALTLLAALFSQMPQATLGAIVLVAGFGLVRLEEVRFIGRIRLRDGALAAVALVTVLFLGALEGILVAVVLSVLTLLYQVSRPPILVLGRQPGTDDFRSLEKHPGDETFSGLIIVRPEGGLFFANADRVADGILALVHAITPPPRVILVDGSAVPDLEYTGLQVMWQLLEQLRREGMDVWVAGMTSRPRVMLRRFRPQPADADRHIYRTVGDGVRAYLADAAKLPPTVAAVGRATGQPPARRNRRD
jgi:sulfate permease, SulP family